MRRWGMAVMAAIACVGAVCSARFLDPALNKYNWMWEQPETRDVLTSIVSRSGNFVVAGSHDEVIGPLRPDFGPGAYVCLFDRRQNMPIFAHEILMDNVEVTSVTCSYDAEFIAYSVASSIFLLDHEGVELWHKELAPMYRHGVAISSDGAFLAAANYNNNGNLVGPTLFYFSTENNQPLWSKLLGADILLVAGVKISSDGRYIACVSASRNGKGPRIDYFDALGANPSEPIWSYSEPDLDSVVVFFDMSSDGRFIVLEANEMILFFDNAIPASGVKDPLWRQEGGGYNATYHEISMSNDGSLVAYAGPHLMLGAYEYIGTIELWETAGGGTQRWSLEHHHDSPSVAISGDGSLIYFGGGTNIQYDPQVGVIDQTGQILWTCAVSGYVSTSDDGGYASAGAGLITGFNYRDFFPLYLFAVALNQPPACEITAPQPTDIVTDTVEVTGTASDSDGQVSSVVVALDGNYQVAEDISGQGDWSAWRMELSLAGIPDGDIMIMAESVNDAYKYSDPAEALVTVRNSTPAATYTPRFTKTPTPTPIPTLTPTPTPPFNQTAFQLVLNQTIYTGGDVLQLIAESYNAANDGLWVNQVVLLDVFGSYYFHPNWTFDFIATEKYLQPLQYYREPLLAVALPYDLEASGPYYFLGALFDHERWTFVGELSVVGFVFE